MTFPSVSEITFRADVLDAAAPVLLKLRAPGCGPCRAMNPVIDEVAVECAGDVALNIEADPVIADRLADRGIPLLGLFRGGKEVGRGPGPDVEDPGLRLHRPASRPRPVISRTGRLRVRPARSPPNTAPPG